MVAERERRVKEGENGERALEGKEEARQPGREWLIAEGEEGRVGGRRKGREESREGGRG